MNAFKVSMVVLATLCWGGVRADGALPNESMMLAAVGLDEAARRIRQSHDARILSAKTKKIDGRKVYVFKVLTGKGRIQHIKIDAESGRVLGRH